MPVVLARSACVPTAVLLVPDVLALNALYPIAVLAVVGVEVKLE